MTGTLPDELPADSAARLPLELAASPELSELLGLAAAALGVTQLWVSVAERDRVAFKADFGLFTAEARAETTLCAELLREGDLVVVPNAETDQRWATHPEVQTGQRLRFLAAAALRTQRGKVLGALCAVDGTPQDAERARRLLALAAAPIARALESRRDRLAAATRAEQRRELLVRQEVTALERSDSQFRSLMASLPVGVAVSHGRVMRFVNRALANILGYDDPSDLEGRETLTVVHPRSLDAIMQRYASMARGQHPGAGILECRRRDGSAVLVEVTSMPATFEAQPAILAIIRDVTESARARQAQAASEARFRALVNFAPVGIFETDAEGNCVYANERLSAITGLALPEMLGKGWQRAIHPDDIAGVLSKRGAAVEAGVGFQYELRFVAPSGIVQAQVQSVPLLNDGERSGYLGAVVDVTELRTAHTALVESLGQKETLLKEIHHRVKNNLQVIASLLRIGRSYVKDAASLNVFNDSIARVHSIALIHERLYGSHDLDRISMQDYLQGLLTELLRANATEQRVTTQVLAGRLFLNMDRCVPIGLIVGELVSNALKHAFTAGHTPAPVVAIALSESADGYQLTVRDNGVGLADAEPSGNTLGLRIVASLVKQLGGQQHIETDGGTAWHVMFPKDSAA